MSASDSAANAATACLHVAIGDWQEFLEEARRALIVLEKLDQEPEEPEKRAESGIGGSSTAATPDDLTVSGLSINNSDASAKNKKKKKKKKNKKAAAATGGKPSEPSDESSGDEASQGVPASSAASTISGSEYSSLPSTALPGDTESIRLAEADKLAAQGTALARSGEPNALARAVQLLGSAIALYPQRAGYYGNRSLCFYRMGDFTSSLNDAELALQREPTNLKYLNRKAQALIQLKRQSDARAVAERMLQLSPNNDVALQLLEDIRRQLLEDNVSAMQSNHAKQDEDLSDDGDTISCAPSSVMFPPVRPSSVTVTNLPASCTQPVLRSVFTNSGIAVTNVVFGPPGSGIATVFVLNAECARQAISKLDGYVMESKVLHFENTR